MDELFHFVGARHPTNRDANYEILQSILKERQLRGRWRGGDPHRVSLRFNPSESLKRGELIDANVVCFCDIRRSELAIHVSKYGEFGLSFYRGILIQQNTRPVTYIPCYFGDWRSYSGETLIKDILAVYESFQEQVIRTLPARNKKR
jgi:hypothetical protein